MNLLLPMTQKTRQRSSFAVMTFLIFVGLHLLLYSYASTGPNLYFYFGWLEVHRHGESWTVEDFHLGGLFAVLLSSVSLTWLLSKTVPRRMA